MPYHVHIRGRNETASKRIADTLIDVKVGIIMDVEASRAIRQAEVGASRR
jgi:hypothetical protein